MDDRLEHAANCADNIQGQIMAVLLDRMMMGYYIKYDVTVDELQVLAVRLTNIIVDKNNRALLEGILAYEDD